MSEKSAGSIMSAKLAIGLVLVSLFSLIAFLAMSAYSPDVGDDSSGQAHAQSKSAIGFAGMRVLLDASGVANAIDRGGDPTASRSGLIVLTPPSYADAKDVARMAGASNWREVLIVLPKWVPLSDPVSYGHVFKGPLEERGDVEKLLKTLSKTTAIQRRTGSFQPRLASDASWFSGVPGDLAKIDSLQTISGEDWEPVIESRDGGAMLAQLGDRPVFVLADPDLMNTHGIADLPTAALALSIVEQLRPADGTIVFDVTLNGIHTTPSLLRKVFEPPFLGATLCAILAALLMGFHAAVRFGTPQAPPPAYARGKAALVNNAADMIRMLKREPRMAQRYAQTTRGLVLRALGVRRPMDAGEADALFKSLGESKNWPELQSEAGQVSNRAQLVGLAQKFYEWRRGMFHAD